MESRDALLGPFIFRDEQRGRISRETLGHTTLESHPIVSVGAKLLLVLPTAVSPAIRRYVVTNLQQRGKLRSFERAFSRRQAQEVERDCLRRLEAPHKFLQPPPPTSLIASACEWLLRYDRDKYIHTILLNDDGLREVPAKGLCSPAFLPRAMRRALNQRITRIAKSCQSTDCFSVGWTLLIVGGLGRARVFDFNTRLRSWHVCAISISDFVLLCNENDRPIRRFLKFLVQKRWATDSGLRFRPV